MQNPSNLVNLRCEIEDVVKGCDLICEWHVNELCLTTFFGIDLSLWSCGKYGPLMHGLQHCRS